MPDTGAMARVDRVLSDRPALHEMDFSENPPLGLWSTDRDCYEFIAAHLRPGDRTLETGSGLSTLVFAACNALHTSITPLAAETERITAYCDSHGIDGHAVTFLIGASDHVLPDLRGDLDLVFIDGCHGFPAPVLDWYYAGERLVTGGILVLDDIQLPAVAQLVKFIDLDPRWASVHRSHKWAAWRRVGPPGSLNQDWYLQPFLTVPAPAGLARLPGRIVRRIRREMDARSQHRG